MPQVVQVRPSPFVLPNQPKFRGQSMEDRIDGVVAKPRTGPINEPVLHLPFGQEAGAPFPVIDQHLHRRGIQRNQSGLAEFRRVNGQDGVVNINVVHGQTKCFGDPQAGDAE
jgi:hypothetical protein